ncbi:MAG: Pls/PosA family non-ribosomal peptide synthetase [Acidimicrobiales bacterium]
MSPDPGAVLVGHAGHPVAWSPGERLHDLFDQTCIRLGRHAGRRLAVDYGGIGYSFAELRDRSHQLAHHLTGEGIAPGQRVALLLGRSVDAYAIVLALSRIGASWVPLDASFPPERIRFLLADSGAAAVLTVDEHTGRFDNAEVPVVLMDRAQPGIGRHRRRGFEPPSGPAGPGSDRPRDLECYVIYTSGSTGQPKGVPIRHSSIVNFVRVAAGLYGFEPGDRVFQGLTIAFDYAFEEIWVPLVAGATLVPAPPGAQMVGDDLRHFLDEQRITAMATVPTVLATVRPPLPSLRLLLVSGEACPADMIGPWLAAGRRVLNLYGPTETTVSATWGELAPGRPITIGRPLPTYTVAILDPDGPGLVPRGGVGEITVGGIGVAEGYLNRPEQTAAAFVDDILGLGDNPSGKLYRTGDLGRITDDGEVEYLGRIDTQVKIRGYRIELTEIEAAARAVPGVGNAVVAPHTLADGSTVLAAWLAPAAPGLAAVDLGAVYAALRAELPSYMVPALLEPIAEIPLLPSGKADRSALPAPTGGRFVADEVELVAPRTETEARLAGLLAEVLGLPAVSVEADFFSELGADSLTLARYVTELRATLGVRRVTLKQLYQHPTIAALAALLPAPIGPAEPSPAVAAAPPPAAASVAVAGPEPIPASTTIAGSAPAPASSVRVPSRAAHVATGVAQVAIQLLVLVVSAAGGVAAFRFLGQPAGAVGTGLRLVAAGGGLWLATVAGLVAVKWLAVGRFTAEPVPLWTTRYVRFWVARLAVTLNPMVLLSGTPAYNLYLRAVGVRVGPGAVVLAPPPVCTDLVSIGAGAVVRHEAVLATYVAGGGWLRPGPISVGERALVGDGSVLSPGTAVGAGAQLGPASALLARQRVPEGAVWQGSPAEPCPTTFDRCEPGPMSRRRRVRFTVFQLLSLALVTLPLSMAPVALAARLEVSWDAPLGTGGGPAGAALRWGVAALVLEAASLAAGAIAVMAVPRLLRPLVTPEVSHPLHGLRWQAARALGRFSNNRFLCTVFGDSAMILGWLSAVGYDLSRATQTGSNFGVDQRHHSPFLCSFDRNTLVSDGLRMTNLEVSATSFRLRAVSVPPDTYLGNVVRYPADAVVGPNCLIATKAAVPVDGPVRTGVGLLGSPAFEIPRTVQRDRLFDLYKQPGLLEQRLAGKLRSNLVTMALYLVRWWLLTFVALGSGAVALGLVGPGAGLLPTAVALALAVAVSTVAGALLSILAERLVTRGRPLQPLYCSLYDPRFWAHERFWKLNYNAFLRVFDGTPLKPWFLRLQGARVGARMFDDGAGLTEPALVTIGDDCSLNHGAALQAHSLEDGTFKSDRIRLGSGCTVGPAALVHYATDLGDGCVVDPDSFVMKGTTVEPGGYWQGNPARPAPAAPAAGDGEPTLPRPDVTPTELQVIS